MFTRNYKSECKTGYIFKQFSEKYHNLTIKVSSEGSEEGFEESKFDYELLEDEN